MSLLDLIFIRKCKLCGKSISGGALCDECRKNIDSAISPVERKLCVGGKTFHACSLLDYNNEHVKKLLFALKRSSNKELFEFCASLFEKMIGSNFIHVVFVPRSRVNKRKYGYDHMQKIAKTLCKDGKYEYKPLLVRRPFTKEQKKLNSKDRIKNVSGAFKIKKNDITTDIVLVDDVITTGSTAVSCITEILNHNKDAFIKLYFLASK